MRGRPDFHRLFSDVEIAELLELVVHAGQLLLNVLGRVRKFFLNPRYVQKNSAVRTAPAFAKFAVYAAGNMIARKQFGRPARVLVALRVPPAFFGIVRGVASVIFRNIVEHETLAQAVDQDPALAAYSLCHQQAAHAGRPDHSRRMELHELHPQQRSAGVISQRMAVAGVLPTVAGYLISEDDSARG